MSEAAPIASESTLGRMVRGLEETFIAALLGTMVLVTFANVVMRYIFNSALIWGLEVTLILFAWLVLFGISYGFKIAAHLGVDAVIVLLPPRARKIAALLAAATCLAYAGLLLKGAWDYWAPFAGLQPTEGRWFPSGFAEGVRSRAFYLTDQVPMPEWLRFIEPFTLNKGFPENDWESYDKLPRVVPYAMLPFAAALILFRLIQATVAIATGRAGGDLIARHDAEDATASSATRNGG